MDWKHSLCISINCNMILTHCQSHLHITYKLPNCVFITLSQNLFLRTKQELYSLLFSYSSILYCAIVFSQTFKMYNLFFVSLNYVYKSFLYFKNTATCSINANFITIFEFYSPINHSHNSGDSIFSGNYRGMRHYSTCIHHHSACYFKKRSP